MPEKTANGIVILNTFTNIAKSVLWKIFMDIKSDRKKSNKANIVDENNKITTLNFIKYLMFSFSFLPR